ADSGGSSPQSSSISRSRETTRFAFSRSSARTARCLPPESGTDRSRSRTSTGPRSRYSIQPFPTGASIAPFECSCNSPSVLEQSTSFWTMISPPEGRPAPGRKKARPYTSPTVFDTLSDKLSVALGDLSGKRRLDEESISRAMREIRLALLEADVNFRVVKDFVARVRERALGEEVLKDLNPGQQVVKVVHDELTELMGTGDSRLAFAGRPPTVILMAGLQGSGKTTASAKLALVLRKEGKKPALVPADLQRPAAIDQPEQLGKQIQIPVYRGDGDPVAVATAGVQRARDEGRDVVIVDTAGRLHVDEALMDELVAVRNAVKPTNVLLVLDSMTGQEAVAVAEAFQERVAFDGVVLTKLDGDARGGAALSVKA